MSTLGRGFFSFPAPRPHVGEGELSCSNRGLWQTNCVRDGVPGNGSNIQSGLPFLELGLGEQGRQLCANSFCQQEIGTNPAISTREIHLHSVPQVFWVFW